MKKKIISLSLASLLCALPLVGCGGGGGANTVPSDKTVIRLLCYDAGYGRTYIEKIARAFEEKVKNVKYEDGKEGVYFDITQSPTSAVGEQVLSGLPNSNVDMFFSDGHTALSLQKKRVRNGYYQPCKSVQ